MGHARVKADRFLPDDFQYASALGGKGGIIQLHQYQRGGRIYRVEEAVANAIGVIQRNRAEDVVIRRQTDGVHEIVRLVKQVFLGTADTLEGVCRAGRVEVQGG